MFLLLSHGWSRWLRAHTGLMVMFVSPIALAGDCTIFPGGDFDNGLRGWTLETLDSPGPAGFAAVDFTVEDVDGYVGFGGPVPEFDSSVLQISTSVLSTPGQVGAVGTDATLSIEVEMTDRILRVVRGGGFFTDWFGSGVDIDIVLSARNEEAAVAELPLFAWHLDPAPGCTGIAIDGTFDGDPPDLYLDLEGAGLSIGEMISISLHVHASVESAVPCSSTASGALMLLDDFSFCSTAPNPYDLDGDDIVGFADLLIVLNAWGQCEAPFALCPDLTGDLIVGFDDLLLLLANWGKGP